MAKQRLDVLLVEKGLAPSRERAKTSIMAGLVFVDEQRVDKPGTLVKEDAALRVAGDGIGYVSRGGLKLAKAVEAFGLDLRGVTAADIGASTGGFTDCMLQNGAAKVYAVDVGYGQLAWTLRNDPRVVNMERTNVRNVTAEDIGEPLDFASIDVAFISLEKVLPAVASLLKPGGELAALIKPQFEAGREKVGKKGVVRDPAVHAEVIARVTDWCASHGLAPRALTYSPVKGPEGNIEYLLHLRAEAAAQAVDRQEIERIVAKAHAVLDK